MKTLICPSCSRSTKVANTFAGEVTCTYCDIEMSLTFNQTPRAEVTCSDGVMCASCRKECSHDDLHEVKGTTTLSNHTMTFRVCDDCDPQDVKTEKHT